MTLGVFVWLLLGGTIAVASVGYGVVVFARQRRRELDDAAFVKTALEAPVRTITDVGDGEWVRVVGVVVAEKTIESPLEKVACVAYSSRVELVTDNVPTPLGARRLVIDFVVENETGRARVAAPGARVVLASRRVHPGPGAIASFVETIDVFSLARAVAYEAALVPGARVAAAGLARWEADPHPRSERTDASYRGSAEPRRLVLGESALGPVVVTDDPRALATA